MIHAGRKDEYANMQSRTGANLCHPESIRKYPFTVCYRYCNDSYEKQLLEDVSIPRCNLIPTLHVKSLNHIGSSALSINKNQ